MTYMLEKRRERKTRNLEDLAFVKDTYGNILVYLVHTNTMEWYDQLQFKVGNDTYELQEVTRKEHPLQLYTVKEVRKQPGRWAI